MIGAPIPASPAHGSNGSAELVQIDTNIDDMNPQIYSAVSDRLFEAGAKDVWLTPIQMKKGRPGVMLSVLTTSDVESSLARLILRETTTLGVRMHTFRHRHEVRREMRSVETCFGPVRVKVKWLAEEPAGASPEYEDCRKLADAAGVAVKQVLEAASAAIQEMLATLSEPSTVCHSR